MLRSGLHHRGRATTQRALACHRGIAACTRYRAAVVVERKAHHQSGRYKYQNRENLHGEKGGISSMERAPVAPVVDMFLISS
jgi:hypothetical protein